MPQERTIQSVLSLLVFGGVLLLLGALLGISGWVPLALLCIVLGTFFCVAGLGVSGRH